MIVVAGTIEIDPSNSPELAKAFDTMRDATLAEPGCLSYQAYADRTEAGSFFIFEKWRDADALAAHFQTPHMGAFGAVLGRVGVRSMDVKKYENASESDIP